MLLVVVTCLWLIYLIERSRIGRVTCDLLLLVWGVSTSPLYRLVSASSNYKLEKGGRGKGKWWKSIVDMIGNTPSTKLDDEFGNVRYLNEEIQDSLLLYVNKWEGWRKDIEWK